MERAWAREHVPALTVILSVVSLVLVFGAVLQLFPVAVLPQWEPLLVAIPHLNAVISLLAIGTIIAGIRAIKAGRIGRHRALMLASFALFVAFLFLYLYRVSVVGPTPFGGPEQIRLFVYLPILVTHIALAIVCIPVVFYALLSAVTRPIEEIPESNHRRAGRAGAALWLISFSFGLVIYGLLYHVF